ncbi:MFS general substrate transporter [Nemania abortiva]|nr:MFS general substrate transporter [Nemania abortiva]
MAESTASDITINSKMPPEHNKDFPDHSAQFSGDASGQNDITTDIDPDDEVQGLKLVLIHISICLCTFIAGLDFNLLGTAIPAITSEFHSTRDIGWYSAAFQVALSTSQPLAGKLYTQFSKKLVYLVSLLVFEVGSLLCALSPSSHAFIVGRALAGLGASGIFAGGFAILSTIIPLHKRTIFLTTVGSTFAVAGVVGPVIAGAFTQNVTWRWCFYINLPIGGAAAALILALLHLKSSKAEKTALTERLRKLDVLGFILFAGSVTMLLLSLQWGGIQYAWSSSVIIGLLVGFGVTFLVFVIWNLRRGESALIPPRLFTGNRNPALLCTAAFFVNGPFQIVIYWLPVWFQGVLKATPVQSGVNFFPTVIADFLAAFIGGILVTNLGRWNPFLLLAEPLVAVGGGLLTTIYPTISSGHWIGYQILGGVGYSLGSNISHTAMQTSLPQDLASLASSTLLTVISLSCSIFIAIGQAVFQRQLQSNLGPVVGEDVVRHIINSGVTDLDSLVSASDLPMVIQKYGLSVSQLFYITAVTPSISFFALLGCKWTSTKSRQNQTEVEGAGEKADSEKAVTTLAP